MAEQEEFEFAMAMEAEQAGTPTPATAVPPTEYSGLDVASDMAREGIKGAAGTVDFLTGLVGSRDEALANLTPEQHAGMEVQDYAALPLSRAVPPISETEAIQDFTARNIPQYPNAVEGAMTGANFAGSALVPFAPVKKVKQGLDLAKNALLFGGGAGAFDAATEDTSTLGKIGAGLATLFGPAGAKNLIKSGRLAGGADKADEAAALINNIALDSKKALATAKEAVARGEKGTLGQLSKDPYILSLEKGATVDNAFSHQLNTINEQIAEAAAADLKAISPIGAKPESMLTQAKARVSETLANIGKRTESKEAAIAGELSRKENVLAKSLAQQATKAADESRALNLETLNRANPSKTPITEVGTKGQAQLGENFTTEYGKAWDKVDHVPISSWLGVKQVAKKGGERLATETDKNTVNGLIKTLDDVANAPNTARVKAFDTTLRNAAESASRENPALFAVIKDMRTSLRDGLEGGVAAELKAIDAFYGPYLATRKAAAKADETGGVYTAEQLNKADKTVAGEKRFVEGRGFMQPSTAPTLGAARATAETTKALESAGKESLRATSARADALRKTALQRGKKVKEESVAGQFASHDDAVNAVDKVFANTTNPLKQTAELIKVAKKDPSGKALDGLKAAYLQSLANKVTAGGRITAAAGDKFKALKGPMGKLFNPEELARVERAIKESSKIRLHKGIDTSTLPEAGKGLKFYAASIFGIKAATSILSGNSLLMGRIGREAAVKSAVTAPHKKMLALMEEMLLNPAKYTAGIEKIKKAPTEKNIAQVLGEWGVRATAADDKE